MSIFATIILEPSLVFDYMGRQLAVRGEEVGRAALYRGSVTTTHICHFICERLPYRCELFAMTTPRSIKLHDKGVQRIPRRALCRPVLII